MSKLLKKRERALWKAVKRGRLSQVLRKMRGCGISPMSNAGRALVGMAGGLREHGPLSCHAGCGRRSLLDAMPAGMRRFAHEAILRAYVGS